MTPSISDHYTGHTTWSLLEESHLQFLMETTSWRFLAIYRFSRKSWCFLSLSYLRVRANNWLTESTCKGYAKKELDLY